MSFDPTDFGDMADLAGFAQRDQTNRLLREQAAERERIAALPDCPYCGGKIPKVGVSVCTHCSKELVWIGHVPSEPTPEKIAEAKRKFEGDQRIAKAQAEARRRDEERERGI